MAPAGDLKDLKSIVTEYINQNKVMIFSKTSCPYCDDVKELLTSLNANFKSLELDTTEKGSEIQNVLFEMTRQKTVPNVFIGGQHIGGCDSTMKLHSQGKLLQMIQGELGK